MWQQVAPGNASQGLLLGVALRWIGENGQAEIGQKKKGVTTIGEWAVKDIRQGPIEI